MAGTGVLAQDSVTIATLTFAAIYVFLPSLPVTHCLGLVAHCPSSAKAKHLLLYPFKGGRHHFIFQVIAWVSIHNPLTATLPSPICIRC